MIVVMRGMGAGWQQQQREQQQEAICSWIAATHSSNSKRHGIQRSRRKKGKERAGGNWLNWLGPVAAYWRPPSSVCGCWLLPYRCRQVPKAL